MKILLAHNRYQQKGGEDAVFDAEASMLERGGHIVERFVVDNSSIRSLGDKSRALAGAAWNAKIGAEVERIVRNFQPDVVHFHNFFPLISPAAHRAGRVGGAAVVQTLHNYRFLCAAGTFVRRGEACTECLHRGRHRAVVHQCYRGSVSGTISVWAMQSVVSHRAWVANVDRFIVLTEFAKQLFGSHGLPSERLFVKSNFCRSTDVSMTGGHCNRSGALFVGRLSHEKGVVSLINAWRRIPECKLSILGDGPLMDWAMQHAPSNVEFLGSVSRRDVLARMRSSEFLVFPSIWFEGFPVTFAEALSAGLPIVAADIGAASEVVTNDIGLRFAPGSATGLVDAVREILSNQTKRREMQKLARKVYEQKYSEGPNLARLEMCYADAIESRKLSS